METINTNNTEKQSKTKKRIYNYFDKCSKHLFIENKRFHKIISFEYENELYYVDMNFDGKTTNMSISKVQNFTPGDLRYYKESLFPDYNSKNRYAIKYFDGMKERMDKVMDVIKKDFKGYINYENVNETKEKVDKILLGMEPKL